METALKRAEELAERVLPDRRAKKRMLVIVNPYATTVSDRLKNLVVYATEPLLSIADDFRPRRVDTGLGNGRHFVFAPSVGLDASVVERVAAHPYRKAKF